MDLDILSDRTKEQQPPEP